MPTPLPTPWWQNIWVGYGIGLLGLIATGVLGYIAIRVTRRYALLKASISLVEKSQFVPKSLGLSDVLQVLYEGEPVPNLVLFELTVSNTGVRDISFGFSAEERKRRGLFFPRVQFRGLRILGFQTLNHNLENFSIWPSIKDGDTVWINIYNLGRKKRARFLVVGTNAGEPASAHLHKGNLPDLEIKGAGMLNAGPEEK